MRVCTICELISVYLQFEMVKRMQQKIVELERQVATGQQQSEQEQLVEQLLEEVFIHTPHNAEY